MTFKNKKEEVIEIELTSFGKHLLSNGKFQPFYYSFFDDDILYDSEFAGSTEEQNYSQTRILEETPVLRAQVQYTGIETEVERQIKVSRSEKRDLKKSFQSTREKNYAMSSPLGRSSYSSEHFPSWDITLYGSNFSQSLSTRPLEDNPTLKIPQLTTQDLMYRVSVVDEVSGTPLVGGTTGHAEDIDEYRIGYENGNYVEILHNNVVIEVDELHTDSLFENYDVEFFLIEAQPDDDDQEVLTPLSFLKQGEQNLVNGILRESEASQEPFDPDDTFVEFYLNVEVDAEIKKSTLCELGYRTDYSKRGHIRVECEDENSESKMSEIYDSDTPNEPFGDDC